MLDIIFHPNAKFMALLKTDLRDKSADGKSVAARVNRLNEKTRKRVVLLRKAVRRLSDTVESAEKHARKAAGSSDRDTQS